MYSRLKRILPPQIVWCYSWMLNTKGGSLINFQIFFPPPRTLLRPPRLLILAKDQKFNFISMRKGQKTVFILRFTYIGGCLKRSLCIVYMFWGDGLKRCCCIAFVFEVSFYKWTHFVTNIKHSFCLLLHLVFQYSYYGWLHI